MAGIDMGALVCRLLALAASLACAAAWAQTAGQVQFATGAAQIERGSQRLPVRASDAVLVGDVVVTGDDGNVQMRMIDAAFISMRPRSRMAVREYAFTPDRPGEGSALIQLVSGVMRTFTGEIVLANRDRFRMATPLASVGIRGSGNILAHLETEGTLNHTLTGAHAVSASDPAVGEGTLVSFPGQTIQVLPGRTPRFVPTPRFILASATTRPASAKADDAATEAAVATGAEAVAPAGEGASATSVATSAARATVAATGAVASVVATAASREALWRFSTPIGGTGMFEGGLGQTGYEGAGGALVNTRGELIGSVNSTMTTFLAGGVPRPPGYAERTLTGEFRFSGGSHRDGFQSSDGSIIMGRWEGGTVAIRDSAAGSSSLELGPRSLVYLSTFPTPQTRWSTFTGSTTYSLASAVAPTDSQGRVGSMASATTTLNFSNLTASGNFALSVNGQSFAVSGSSALTGAPSGLFWGFATSTGTVNVSCAGVNCSPLGYQATFNGELDGARGEFIAYIYRVNPARQPGQGYGDQITGAAALQAATPPAPIAVPETPRSLAFVGRQPALDAALAASVIARSPMLSLPRPLLAGVRRGAQQPIP